MAKLGFETGGNPGGAGYEGLTGKDSYVRTIGDLATNGAAISESIDYENGLEAKPGINWDAPVDGRCAESGPNMVLPLGRDPWGMPMSPEELREAGARQTFKPYIKKLI